MPNYVYITKHLHVYVCIHECMYMQVIHIGYTQEPQYMYMYVHMCATYASNGLNTAHPELR